MMNPGVIPVIDLFAGPGGLSEGFSALGLPGSPRFRVCLSIERDSFAHQTLELRSFFRQFRDRTVPDAYYDCLRDRLSRETLYAAFPAEAAAARNEAWHAELGVTPATLVAKRISEALERAATWVLIGGPPCQAYSTVGRSRNKGNRDYRAERDRRQFLYAEYLQIIADHWPSVFVLENVKGLLSATLYGSRIFDQIIEDLQAPAKALKTDRKSARGQHTYRIYALTGSSGPELSPGDYVVQAELYGVPQARHRVILVGVRDDVPSGVPRPLKRLPSVSIQQVLGCCPTVRSGLSRGLDDPTAWVKTVQSVADRALLSSIRRAAGSDVADSVADAVRRIHVPALDRGRPFIQGDWPTAYRRDWFCDERLGGMLDHVTREHMPLDLQRYIFAACFAQVRQRSPFLTDFPAEFLPDHKSAKRAVRGEGYFNDRFRVQGWATPSTTVTSHIAKDGHAFIHPDPTQCRSLTVREAARLQTFPDNYAFCGPRTQRYGQVGNAVPPLLAAQIADVVFDLLR